MGSKELISAIVGVLLGAVVGIGGTFFMFQGRVSKLETHIEYLKTAQPAAATLTVAPQSVSTSVAATLTALLTPNAPATATAEAQKVAEFVAATLTAQPTPSISTTRTPTAQPSGTPASPPSSSADALVALAIAPLWSGPGLDNEVIETLSQWEALKVLGKDTQGDWLKVETASGHTGWMRKRYLVLNVSLSMVPVLLP